MKKNIALVSGGFDPLHRGHIQYMKAAKVYSDYLIVALNSDDWLQRKKKFFFMSWQERVGIIENLSFVDQVIAFDDSDDSASDSISESLKIADQVLFCNGGDRSNNNCQELNDFENDPRVTFHFGVGGDNKLNSSSWMIKDFYKKYSSLVENNEVNTSNEVVNAPWGSHEALIDKEGYKFKELKVNPGSKLSLQKHYHREEFWLIHKGSAFVEVDGVEQNLLAGNIIHVPQESKHRITNKTDEELVILEIQRGPILEEEDIVRYEDQYGRTPSK